MARRPAPPSSSPHSDEPRPQHAPRTSASAPSGRRTRTRTRLADRAVDVREWASGIRLSAFAAIMLSLVVLGTWVLVPTIGTYLDQRQKIAALEHSVQLTEEQIAELEREQARWDDPVYITTQARERLYYVRPGQVPYLVDFDLDPADLPPAQQEVSEELQQRGADWMPHLLRSMTAAGLAQTAVGTPAR
ncbi:septum formation initiator family protein [Microbacterium esteraromaticum]|uniref:FtsB family cell division protein n=1 Tax=Microbacterium esteraromaticum TaxID=57043 RepID=UPI0015C88448|nr:septum formation initiator family protein [Microbacterium esteraromaticum]WDH79687.1 septum formation initiator family protein [Microbacterium esteraromaticum]